MLRRSAKIAICGVPLVLRCSRFDKLTVTPHSGWVAGIVILSLSKDEPVEGWGALHPGIFEQPKEKNGLSNPAASAIPLSAEWTSE